MSTKFTTLLPDQCRTRRNFELSPSFMLSGSESRFDGWNCALPVHFGTAIQYLRRRLFDQKGEFPSHTTWRRALFSLIEPLVATR